LYNEGHISYDEAIANADSANELRLNIKLKSVRGEPPSVSATSLSMEELPSPEVLEALRREELRKQEERRRELEDQQLAKMREKRRLEEDTSARGIAPQ
jgi:twitching motility protein PilU